MEEGFKLAQRRMFSKRITDTDIFTDMPLSSQCLYFHLNMNGDDDGFVDNTKRVQKMIGASDDDLKLLFAKEFLIPFESGVVVIKDWKVHNYIRGDRYQETVYVDEKSQLTVDKTGKYKIDIPTVDQMTYQRETQVRLGKDRLGKENNTSKSSNKNSIENDFEKLWELYPNKKGKKDAFNHYKRAIKNGATNKQIQDGIVSYKRDLARNDWMKPAMGSTWFNKERWDDDYEIPQQVNTTGQSSTIPYLDDKGVYDE